MQKVKTKEKKRTTQHRVQDTISLQVINVRTQDKQMTNSTFLYTTLRFEQVFSLMNKGFWNKRERSKVRVPTYSSERLNVCERNIWGECEFHITALCVLIFWRW